MLMIPSRYRIQAAAIESLATHPHPQDRPPPLLRHRHRLRAHRRGAAVRQLESSRDKHRLLAMHKGCAGVRTEYSWRPNTSGQSQLAFQEPDGAWQRADLVSNYNHSRLPERQLAVAAAGHTNLPPTVLHTRHSPSTRTAVLPPYQLLPEPPAIREVLRSAAAGGQCSGSFVDSVQ